jgi:hypothetical protein
MQGILPLEYLLAAPLESVVRAQAMAARATAEFVGEVGFETDKDGVSRVRTVEFEYIHPQSDPDQPGNRLDLPVRVQVPVLSLLTIPNVTVDEATVEMQLRIVAAQQQETIKPTDGRRTAAGPANLRANALPLPFPADRIRMVGAVTAPRAAEQTASLKVSIRMKQAPVPEGLSQILGLLSEATTARPTREQ